MDAVDTVDIVDTVDAVNTEIMVVDSKSKFTE